MQKTAERALVLALTTLASGAMLGGCVYRREVVPAAAPATVIVAPSASSDRVVTYPDGRYEHRWNVLQVYFGGNCIRTGEWQENGTLASAGEEFTFNPGRIMGVRTRSVSR